MTNHKLLADLRKAEGPDRKLDAAVWITTLPTKGTGLDGCGLPDDSHYEYEPRGDGSVDGYVVFESGQSKPIRRFRRQSPAFTASVDAVLALVERLLPGSTVSVGIGGDNITCIYPVPNAPVAERWSSCSGGHTPAIAILIALLTALDKEQP